MPEDVFDLSGGSSAAKTANVGSATDDGGMVFDLTGVDEKGPQFEVIPKGTYPAIIEDMQFGESSSSKPMITMTYSLTDPEYENRKVFDYMVLAGDGAQFGLAKLKKLLARVFPDADMAHFNPKDFCDNGDAINHELQLVLGIQTQKTGDYKGQKRNTVRDILAPDNSGSFI